jgi:hypothetical protein
MKKILVFIIIGVIAFYLAIGFSAVKAGKNIIEKHNRDIENVLNMK